MKHKLNQLRYKSIDLQPTLAAEAYSAQLQWLKNQINVEKLRILSCRSVVRQRPQNKQIDNCRYYTTARKQQKRNSAFCKSVSGYYKQGS
jgi:hypothetical protein